MKTKDKNAGVFLERPKHEKVADHCLEYCDQKSQCRVECSRRPLEDARVKDRSDLIYAETDFCARFRSKGKTKEEKALKGANVKHVGIWK